MGKRIFQNLIVVTLPGLLMAAVVLELAFRFVIPATEQPHTYFDPNDQVLKLQARPSEGVFTAGKFAQLQARWRVNNAGWNSDIHYFMEGRTRPLIAIIGDSYIQALQVDTDKSVAARLRDRLDGRYDVYSFGINGISLAQYLHLSRYVSANYNPDVLVISVVHNDFEASLCDRSRNIGVLCLEQTGLGIQEAEIVPSTYSWTRRLAAKSSLVRYLYFNARVRAHMFRRNKSEQGKYNANVDVESARANRRQIEEATIYVLKKLAEENPDKRIIIVMDGPRNDIYQDRVETSSVLWMNKLLGEKAREDGFQFIDLTDHFLEKHRQNSQIRFESPYDSHWNETGHSIVAEALFGELTVEAIAR